MGFSCCVVGLHWQELCISVTVQGVKDAMKYMDKDGSGAIGFKEFLDWYDGEYTVVTVTVPCSCARAASGVR